MSDPKTDTPQGLSDAEIAARNRRNLWLGLGLLAFVLIVLAVTMVRISQGTLTPPDGGF
ncbi:MAG: hypothetical protein AAF253_07565 [Pseudomonadota bacterium]